MDGSSIGCHKASLDGKTSLVEPVKTSAKDETSLVEFVETNAKDEIWVHLSKLSGPSLIPPAPFSPPKAGREGG
jgi:hypothetical protein